MISNMSKNIRKIIFTITDKQLYNTRIKIPVYKDLFERIVEWENNVNNTQYWKLKEWAGEFYIITDL